MKYSILIPILFIGISHAFFGNIGGNLNNIGNTIDQIGNGVNQGVGEVGNGIDQVIDNGKNQIENLAGQLLNIANGIQFAARFLWDSIFNPAIDLLASGGQLFFNNQLGSMTNTTGQLISIPDNPFMDKYAEIIARFKTNLRILYEQLFLIEQEAMKAIGEGEMNFEGHIRAFYDKINEIEKQLNQWANEMKSELDIFASTIAGDWNVIINQYKQNIDSTIQSIRNMFEKLSENLMKNFLDFASTFVSNANNIIDNMKGQGFLSFLGRK